MTWAQLDDSQKALARSAEMRLSLSVARSVARSSDRSIGAAFLLAVRPSVSSILAVSRHYGSRSSRSVKQTQKFLK